MRLDEHTMGEEIMAVSLHARTHAHARTSHSGRVLIGTSISTKLRAEAAMAVLAETDPEEYVRIMGLSSRRHGCGFKSFADCEGYAAVLHRAFLRGRAFR